MSATLSWQISSLGTKTGTTLAEFITDLVSLVNTKSGDANYKWQIAGSSTAGNPNWIVLKPKSGAAGRILIVAYTSLPAGNNAAILEGNPSTTAPLIAFFPSGNVDTPSNLTAASGTIMGNDANAVKCSAFPAISSCYAASVQHFYVDTDEGMYFLSQNPAAASLYMTGAGYLTVDGADAVYATTVGFVSPLNGSFGTPNGAGLDWAASAPIAGSATKGIRCNYVTNSAPFFIGLVPTGNLFNTVPGVTDMLTNTATSQAGFFAVPLAGHVKCAGFPLRFRQLGWGPLTNTPGAIYSTTGPIVAARQVNNYTSGGSFPWVTNFKM